MKHVLNRFSLLILLLVVFIDWMSIGLVYPMFSSMIFHKELPFFPAETSDMVRGFWLGALLALGPLAQFFSSPLLGTLSDQKGRKPLLKIGLMIMIFGYFFSALGVWFHNLWALLIGRFIVGIGSGTVAVVNASVADMSDPNEKAKNFGLVSMAYGVGFTVGPFLGGIISSWGGYDKPFLFAGLIALMNLILLIFCFRETHPVGEKATLSITMGLKNLKKALFIPGIRILFFCVFIACVGWSFYWEFIPVTWIEGYKLTVSQVGNFYAYGAGVYALSSGLLIRPIVNRFPGLPVLFFSLMILGVAVLLLLFHSRVEFFWLYIPIQQYLIALFYPTSVAIISNSVGEDVQGELMGILASVEAFAFGVSPLLAGVFIGMGYNMPIIVGGIAMFFAAAILPLGYRKKVFNLKF